MARLRATSVGIPWADERDWQEHDRLEDAAVEAAKAELRATADGPLVGEELRWGRGDGYARYLIARESPLTLVHLAVGDAWEVEAETIRGLRLADARRMVQANRNRGSLFPGTIRKD